MEFQFAWRRISARLKQNFKKWRPVFALALLLTLLVQIVCLSERMVCSALVHFNYTGIESGYDPNGNRFDPTEMKNVEIVRQAAETAGRNVTDEDVERIRAALEISGSVSDSVFDKVTEKTSIFKEDEIAEQTDIRETAYFPAHYTVKLRYADAGFTSEDATRFLNAFLDAYQAFFYEKYGYHTSFQQALDNADYQSYDYVDAVDVLNSHLTTLRAYLARMENQDHTGFVSKETGYSFLDLIGTVDTLRNENVQWVTSYIVSNNMTKDRQYLLDYYQYKIEDAGRALEQQDARLFTLNEQINSYVKTNAVFPIMGDGAGEQGNDISETFEFAQPSQMYNSLINQKVACQTAISETQEQIDMLTRRMERLRTEQSSGDPAIVEAQLKTVDEKTRQLLSDIQRTSDEFYKSEWLNQAFQTLKEPKAHALALDKKDAVLNVLTVEILLVGLCALSSLWSLRKAKYDAAAENRPGKETASQ